MLRRSARAACVAFASLSVLACQPVVSDSGQGGDGGGQSHDGCSAMVEAFCGHVVDCGMQEYGSIDECTARQQLACEVDSRVDGVKMDIETLVACAPALDQASCEAVGSLDVPACRMHGSRPAGAGCALGAQCATGLCSGEPLTCGVCLTPKTEGEACVDSWSLPGPAPALCGDGLYCDMTSKRCKKRGGRGDACDFDAPCADLSVCLDGLCHAPLGSGVVCDGTSGVCDGALGLWCDPSSQRCAKVPPWPGPGSPCTMLDDCAFGSFCELSSGICRPDVADGAACDVDPCIPPAECSGGTCVVAVDGCP